MTALGIFTASYSWSIIHPPCSAEPSAHTHPHRAHAEALGPRGKQAASGFQTRPIDSAVVMVIDLIQLSKMLMKCTLSSRSIAT